MRKLARKITIKSTRINKLEAELKRKNMHGQFVRYLNQPYVDNKRINQWLKSSTLKRSTESTIAAIQEQAVSAKYIEKHVFNVEVDDTCRICRVEKETIHHIKVEVAMVSHQQNTSNAMITSANTFMFSCDWDMDLSRNKYHGTNTNLHK